MKTQNVNVGDSSSPHCSGATSGGRYYHNYHISLFELGQFGNDVLFSRMIPVRSIREVAAQLVHFGRLFLPWKPWPYIGPISSHRSPSSPGNTSVQRGSPRFVDEAQEVPWRLDGSTHGMEVISSDSWGLRFRGYHGTPSGTWANMIHGYVCGGSCKKNGQQSQRKMRKRPYTRGEDGDLK